MDFLVKKLSTTLLCLEPVIFSAFFLSLHLLNVQQIIQSNPSFGIIYREKKFQFYLNKVLTLNQFSFSPFMGSKVGHFCIKRSHQHLQEENLYFKQINSSFFCGNCYFTYYKLRILVKNTVNCYLT